MLVYIAGKYTAPTYEERQENINAAKEVAIACWNKGHTVLCPHMNTANLDELTNLTYDDWIIHTLKLLSVCDAVVLVANWRGSKGAKGEVDYAMANNIPVFASTNLLPSK